MACLTPQRESAAQTEPLGLNSQLSALSTLFNKHLDQLKNMLKVPDEENSG